MGNTAARSGTATTHGASVGGVAGVQGSDGGGWADMHYKDVAPPAKYKGDVNQWRHWFTKFCIFMARRNVKWDNFFNAILEDSKVPGEICGEKEAVLFYENRRNLEGVDAKD